VPIRAFDVRRLPSRRRRQAEGVRAACGVVGEILEGKEMTEEKKRIYCSMCKYWYWRIQYKCVKVVEVMKDTPVAPYNIYGDHAILNKHNDCPHYQERPQPPAEPPEPPRPWWKFWIY